MIGVTGAGKTELAALIQQHFGAKLCSRNLPGSWMSTGNALEAQSFASKDAVFVIDDFAPAGTQLDVNRMHREATRLLRAQGNQAGRVRMRSDSTLRQAKRPRGLVISTGESIPSQYSIRARLLIIEVGSSDVNFVLLSAKAPT